MALFKFTKKIVEGEPIDIYNNGDMRRDFTYITISSKDYPYTGRDPKNKSRMDG